MTTGRERLPYAATLSAITDAGAPGEIVPTEDGQLVVMDGVTPGGFPLARVGSLAALDLHNVVGTVASTGTTGDASAALIAADATNTGYVRLVKGVTRVAASLTLSTPLSAPQGATLRPAAGVTVTLSGGVAGADAIYQMFDLTEGGFVVFPDGSVPHVRPEWWGASVSASDAQNSSAIRAARDSIVLRGTVRFCQGSYSVNSFVGINRSYIVYQGDGDFGTVFVNTGIGDTTGIDGGLNATTLLDHCQHLNIGTFRATTQTAVVPTAVDVDANIPLPSGIPTGGRGFIHRSAAESTIRHYSINDPIGYYQTQTTSAHGLVICARQSLQGDVAGTKWVGIVSDCTNAGVTGTSSNGSCYIDFVANGGPFIGESWGRIDYGSDLRDELDNVTETANTSHGYDIIGAGSILAWDIKQYVTVDGWTISGLRVANFNVTGRAFFEGYSTTSAAGTGVQPAVQLIRTVGVTISPDFEAKGGVDFAMASGYYLLKASRCRIFGAVDNVEIGCDVNGGGLNRISINLKSDAGHSAQTGVMLRNATFRNKVSAVTIDAVDNNSVAVGVNIDNTATNNDVMGDCIINPGAVVVPVKISGTNITGKGAYSNGNRVFGGVYDADAP